MKRLAETARESFEKAKKEERKTKKKNLKTVVAQ